MSEICSVIQRKAKKIHFCDVCGKPIIPESEYLAIRSAEDGRFWHNKEHIHCDALLDAYTRQTGLGLDFGRMDMVVTWLCAKACSECSHESSCRLAGQDIFGCTAALRRVLQPTVLHAAMESVRKNIDVEES